MTSGSTCKDSIAFQDVLIWDLSVLSQDQVSLQFTSRVSLTSESAALLPPSMLSFVVPAHNEQACLGRTVQAIHAAARATGRPYEVIVVDDASTDATAEVA